jgi:hypothetical protein
MYKEAAGKIGEADHVAQMTLGKSINAVFVTKSDPSFGPEPMFALVVAPLAEGKPQGDPKSPKIVHSLEGILGLRFGDSLKTINEKTKEFAKAIENFSGGDLVNQKIGLSR